MKRFAPDTSKTIKLNGFALYPHQMSASKELTPGDNTGKIVVVNACRQVGKSWLAINELIKFCTKPRSASALVTTSFRLARTLYDMLNNILQPAGLVVKTNAQGLSLVLINGSSVSFFSAEQREKLRGYTISGIMIIDEAAFIPDSTYYDYLRPWVNVHKCPTLILSTPDFERGFFYDLYQAGRSPEPNNIVTVDFMDYPDSIRAIRPAEVVERDRRTLPVQTFRSETLGLWRRAEGSVFGNFENLILQHKPATPTKLFWGVDWGTGSNGDYTVVTAFNQDHEMTILWTDNQTEPVKQVEKIGRLFDKYKDVTEAIMVEGNSIGKLFLNLLRRTGHKIEEFQTTAKTKRKIVQTMQVDIQNGQVFFLDDHELKIQFSAFEAKAYEDRIIYTAPAGQHDDIVMATLIANFCFHVRKSRIRCLF